MAKGSGTNRERQLVCDLLSSLAFSKVDGAPEHLSRSGLNEYLG